MLQDIERAAARGRASVRSAFARVRVKVSFCRWPFVFLFVVSFEADETLAGWPLFLTMPRMPRYQTQAIAS